MNPTEEQTFRKFLEERLDRRDEAMDKRLDRIEKNQAEGFSGVYKRQDHTNGTVAWHTVIIYATLVGLAVLALAKYPELVPLIAHFLP